jgi:hypothetical protein
VAVFFDSDRVAQAALPTYTEARDALPELFGRFADEDLSGRDPDEVIARVVAALSRGDGCEAPPTARVVARDGADPVTVTIDHRFGCDDSGGGVRYELTIGSAADPMSADDAWWVQNATARTLCLRGGGPAFCV